MLETGVFLPQIAIFGLILVQIGVAGACVFFATRSTPARLAQRCEAALSAARQALSDQEAGELRWVRFKTEVQGLVDEVGDTLDRAAKKNARAQSAAQRAEQASATQQPQTREELLRPFRQRLARGE